MKPLRLISITFFFVFACNVASPMAPPPENSPTDVAPQPTEPAELPPPIAGSPADIIFTNGVILTMDDANPNAEVIAVQGNTILAVGSINEVFTHRGENTIVVDLKGRTLVPGYIDSHQHRIGDRSKRNYTEADPVIKMAIEQGWTTLNELFVNQARLNELIALDGESRLRLRVNAYLPVMDNSAEGRMMAPYYENYSPGQMVSPHVQVAGLKVFTDFDNAAILLWRQNDLNEFLLKKHREGWQLALKTVSTRSLEMILNAFEYIETSDPEVIKSRGRLEHALFLTPEQIVRVKHLGLIPSIQTNMPGELISTPDLAVLMSREPQGSAFPWRGLVDADIIIADGSAWPTLYVDEPTGAPFGSPVHLIYQAVTRIGNLSTQPEPWMLDQTITAEDAMRALTINAAYANFQEDVLGSLTPGKLADMVILSDNPLKVSAAEINNIQVLMTMIDGKAEYCAGEFELICPSGPDYSNSFPFGHIDVPTANETLSGSIEIAGWALDDSGIERVEIYVDGNFVANAFYGTPRPDVERDYPGRLGSPNFGYMYKLHTTLFSNGSHIIQAIAYGKSGNKSALIPENLMVTINN